MVQRRSKMWPHWNVVYEFWASLRVPVVSFQKYVPGRHSPNAPWIWRATSQQMLMPNPQINTAWHLAETFRNSPPEFVAAYKLYASCRQHNIWIFEREIVVPWFQALGMELNVWWHGNARSVLPSVDQLPWPHEQRGDEPKGWCQLVELSASEWRAVAEQWSILIVPGMTDSEGVGK